MMLPTGGSNFWKYFDHATPKREGGMVWIPTKIEHVVRQDDLLGMLQAMLMDHNLMVKKKPIQVAEHKVAGWIYPSHDALDVE